MGLHVAEADTASAIQQTLPQLFENGKFVGRETYAAVLAQQNLTIQEFEESMSRQVLLNRLRSIVLEGTIVSPAEVEREFQRRTEKAKVEYIRVSPDKLRGEVQVSAEEVRSFFDKGRSSYQIGEKRGFKLLLLDPAKLEESISVSDEELRRAYEQNKDRYRTPERVKVRHILLKTTDKSKEEEAKIKARAEGLLKQIRGGADFAELAKTNSEDPGSASKGGELDWVVHGQTVPEFESVAFSLKPKEISNLVKTQYGFHVLQVLEKQQARLRPLEEVRGELLVELKKQTAADRVQSTVDQAVAELKKNPGQVEQIARAHHLSLINVEKAGPGDPIPEIGINRDFRDSVAMLRKGEVSQPVQAPGNRLVFALVTDVFPARPAEFEEVEQSLRQTLLSEKANRLVEKRANEVMQKVKSLNGDLQKAAQAMGLEVTTSAEFTRVGAIEGLGSASSVPEAFTKPAGTLFGPIFIGNSRVIGKVVARISPNMADLAAQRNSIRDELRRNRARERSALFEEGIRNELIRTGKLKIHQDVVQRLITGFRG